MLLKHQQSSDLTFSGLAILFLFLRDFTNHILSARPSPYRNAFWRGDNGKEIIRLLRILRKSLLMRGLTVIDLKSFGLVTPVVIGILVTIPILNGDAGKPVSSQSRCS